MILYHTVEDRDNPDEVEANAPFLCDRKTAWLGQGYYFWDTFIENAHWWGKTVYSNGYIIVEYSCVFQSEKCFDLQGNMEHVKIFNETIEFLEEKGLFNKKSTTVAQVIEFMKKGTDFESVYEGIRIYGHGSKPSKAVYFNLTKPQYFNSTPAVQLCLFRKSSLGLSVGKIIYPAHYNIGYMI